jgi:hypothetical protein
MKGDALRMLREALARSPEQLRRYEVDASRPLQGLANLRFVVTTGAGSSAGHARYLAALLAEHGIPARFLPLDAFPPSSSRRVFPRMHAWRWKGPSTGASASSSRRALPLRIRRDGNPSHPWRSAASKSFRPSESTSSDPCFASKGPSAATPRLSV